MIDRIQLFCDKKKSLCQREEHVIPGREDCVFLVEYIFLPTHLWNHDAPAACLLQLVPHDPRGSLFVSWSSLESAASYHLCPGWGGDFLHRVFPPKDDRIKRLYHCTQATDSISCLFLVGCMVWEGRDTGTEILYISPGICVWTKLNHILYF